MPRNLKKVEKIMLNNPNLKGIFMAKYGFKNVCALALPEEVQEAVIEIESMKASGLLNGKGKNCRYSIFKAGLIEEHKYFESHPFARDIGSKRWQDFCGDCVLLAALAKVLHNVPIDLLDFDPSTNMRLQ